jgi:hypothetical protein
LASSRRIASAGTPASLSAAVSSRPIAASFPVTPSTARTPRRFLIASQLPLLGRMLVGSPQYRAFIPAKTKDKDGFPLFKWADIDLGHERFKSCAMLQ